MAATLDFKNPCLVIAGHWNAAILNEPGWVAKNILEIPEGQQVNLQAVMVGSQISPTQIAPQKQVWVYDSFGLACDGARVELFTRDIDDLQPLYDALLKLTELLPHTPATAVGFNFNVQVADDIAAITPMLETNEVFDAFGATRAQDRTDSIDILTGELIEVEDIGRLPTTLNLTRKTDFRTAEMNFNYHTQLLGMDMLSNVSRADPIGHWYNHAKKVLVDCYGIDALGAEYF